MLREQSLPHLLGQSRKERTPPPDRSASSPSRLPIAGCPYPADSSPPPSFCYPTDSLGVRALLALNAPGAFRSNRTWNPSRSSSTRTACEPLNAERISGCTSRCSAASRPPVESGALPRVRDGQHLVLVTQRAFQQTVSPIALVDFLGKLFLRKSFSRKMGPRTTASTFSIFLSSFLNLFIWVPGSSVRLLLYLVS